MKTGDLVIHPGIPSLGIGIILRVNKGSDGELTAYTRWDNSPAKGYKAAFLQLAPPGTPIPEKFLQPFDEALNKKSTSFDGLVKRFLQKYPESFYDPAYLQDERDYKVNASVYFASIRSAGQIASLLGQERFSEIVSLALEVFGPKHTNLLYPKFDGDYPRLKKGLDAQTTHELFARSLHGLLASSADTQAAFDEYATMLDEIGADTWPNATIPLFLADYENYVFVKPTIFLATAELCDYRIDCSRPITWKKYRAILDFCSHLKTKLARDWNIHARDMIDVQSFIYVASTD